MRRASCLNTSIIQIPALEFFHGSGTPTPPADRLVTTGAPSETDHQVHTPARLQPGKLLDGPARHLAPRRNFHGFTPNGRKSSRQLTSINRLPDFNRWPRTASPAPRLQQQETRPVSSPQLTRHSAPATASFSDRVCARNPHILYLPVSHPNNPLLQALPRAFTPSPPRPRRRCRAKWRPPRPPSSERSTRPRRPPTFRCRACTVG